MLPKTQPLIVTTNYKIADAQKIKAHNITMDTQFASLYTKLQKPFNNSKLYVLNFPLLKTFPCFGAS